jgi:hypothetical protein
MLKNVPHGAADRVRACGACERDAGASCDDARSGVGLIAPVRQHHHWHAGREHLHHCAVAAVRNRQGGLPEHFPVRNALDNHDVG